MIRSVIIDDESDSIKTLEWKIENYCPEVAVTQSFQNPVQGLDYLKSNSIDLLFLDIEMPRLNGFDILQGMGNIPFDVIFTTAYDEFGIQAIKFSALDYLLKPVQISELQKAVAKHQEKRRNPGQSRQQMQMLFKNIELEQEGKPGFIALATRESIEFAQPEEILYCASDSNYTMIYFCDGRKKLVARTLKEFDQMLSEHQFFRVHQSYLVNIRHIKEYIRTDGGYLILKNKAKIPISKRKRKGFLKLVAQWSS